MFCGISNKNDKSFNRTPFLNFILDSAQLTHAGDALENPTFMYFKWTQAGLGAVHMHAPSICW